MALLLEDGHRLHEEAPLELYDPAKHADINAKTHSERDQNLLKVRIFLQRNPHLLSRCAMIETHMCRMCCWRHQKSRYPRCTLRRAGHPDETCLRRFVVTWELSVQAMGNIEQLITARKRTRANKGDVTPGRAVARTARASGCSSTAGGTSWARGAGRLSSRRIVGIGSARCRVDPNEHSENPRNISWPANFLKLTDHPVGTLKQKTPAQ